MYKRMFENYNRKKIEKKLDRISEIHDILSNLHFRKTEEENKLLCCEVIEKAIDFKDNSISTKKLHIAYNVINLDDEIKKLKSEMTSIFKGISGLENFTESMSIPTQFLINCTYLNVSPDKVKVLKEIKSNSIWQEEKK